MTDQKQTTVRITRIGVLGVAATLLVTACSPSTTASDPSPTPQVEQTSRASAGSAPLDHVEWNLPEGEPATIDPPNAATYSGATILGNLCDALLAYDEDYNLTSNLVSVEQPDPRTLVYTLEADATFWDGNPVTVDDIVYSLERAADPMSVVSYIFANVASIEATADDQVTVTLAEPDALFNPSMATFAGMVVERSFAEEAGEDFGTTAGGIMCSGPYELVDWAPGDSIDVVRNDDYWNDTLPMLAETATFRFITDTSALTQALNTGEIDGTYQVDPSVVEPLKASSEGRVIFGPSMESMNIFIARPDGPLADVAVREALQKSIDREALASVIYHGAADPLYTFVAPRTWPNAAAAEWQAAYDGWAAARQYDPEGAAALVEGSSYDGAPLVLGIAAGSEIDSLIAQLVQQQAQAAGLTIEISEVQPLEFSTASWDTETRDRLGLDLMLGANFNATPEPLEPMGFTLEEGSPYNYTEFDDPEAQELLRTARATTDDAERAALTIQAQEISEAASTVVPLVSTNTVTFLNNRMGGAITSFAYMMMPSLAYLGGVGE